MGLFSGSRYVKMLERRVEALEIELTQNKDDNKKLVNALCQARVIPIPFGQTAAPGAALLRRSLHDEIGRLESRYAVPESDIDT